MSHFYGRLSANDTRQEKTKAGHRTTGIQATVQSHRTSVHILLYHIRDVDNCRITVIDDGCYYELYDGPLEEMTSDEKVYAAVAKRLLTNAA